MSDGDGDGDGRGRLAAAIPWAGGLAVIGLTFAPGPWIAAYQFDPDQLHWVRPGLLAGAGP